MKPGDLYHDPMRKRTVEIVSIHTDGRDPHVKIRNVRNGRPSTVSVKAFTDYPSRRLTKV